MSRHRITKRPGKSSALFGGVMGALFVLLGIFVIIPMAGLIGVIWTLAAAAIAGMSLYQAFGKTYVGPEIHIESEDEGQPAAAAERMRQLQELYAQGLVTREEFEAKRKEILREL